MSRPIEGLDSLRASRTLRSQAWRANECASRLKLGVRTSALRACGSTARLRNKLAVVDLVSRFADASRPRGWQARISFAAFGQRRSCRGPRRAETRHLFQKQMRRTAGWAGARIAGESDRCGRKSPVRQPRSSSAARWRARGGCRSHGARGRPAVQAGLQMHVSRRAESLPTLPQRPCSPGTPGAQRRATAPQAKRVGPCPPCRSNHARPERPARSAAGACKTPSRTASPANPHPRPTCHARHPWPGTTPGPHATSTPARRSRPARPATRGPC